MKRRPSIPATILSGLRPLLSLVVLWCVLTAPALAAGDCHSDLETMAAWMCGSFSSEEQAQQDPTYFDIRLHMVRIWKDRGDGVWLYIEQARHDYIDRPYRQRVYHLRDDRSGVLQSHVFTFQDPLRFAGAWRTPERFDQLSPSDLESRDGCTLFLHRQDDRTFSGVTSGTGCESSINGAAYATSEATITPDGMVSWDRGYAADGRQVWGATAGGYRFKKLREAAAGD